MTVRTRTHGELEAEIERAGKLKADGHNAAYLHELYKIMKLFEDMEYTVRMRLEPFLAYDPEHGKRDMLIEGKIDALKWFLNRGDKHGGSRTVIVDYDDD